MYNNGFISKQNIYMCGCNSNNFEYVHWPPKIEVQPDFVPNLQMNKWETTKFEEMCTK